MSLERQFEAHYLLGDVAIGHVVCILLYLQVCLEL